MLVDPDRSQKSGNGKKGIHTLDTSVTRALLLNATYEPLKIISWQRAIILWFQGKVEVLEYHSVFARSVCSSFQIPSVLRLKNYVRPRNFGVVRFCRENVYIRDNFTCQYCSHQFPVRVLTLDHVIPVSKSGPKSWTNVVAACRECNQRKGNKTPKSAGMPLLREPKAPSWLPAQELDSRSSKLPSNWLQYLHFKAG